MIKPLISIFIIILTIGCTSKKVDEDSISQNFDSLDMNIYSKEGKKLYSVNSPYSSYDKNKQIFNLKETTIHLFKDNKPEYIINSDSSDLSNIKKTLNLTGNVHIKSLIGENDVLNANNFFWNFNNSQYLLRGNVKFENDKIILSSNKAILDKSKNIIEFFNPVKYIIKQNNLINKYEINSENAFYNIDTKSLSFTSSEKRVRSKLYF